MYFKVYIDEANEHRWTLYAANHQAIANSGEGYKNKTDCLHAIDLVKGSAAAEIVEG